MHVRALDVCLYGIIICWGIWPFLWDRTTTNLRFAGGIDGLALEEEEFANLRTY